MAVHQIMMLLQAGRAAEAEAACRKALSQRPKDVDLLHCQALALLKTGRAEAALRPLDKALKERPDFAAAANTKGVVLEKLGRPAEAVIAYRLALALAPSAQVWFNLGNACRRAGDDPGALTAYEQAYRLDPGALRILSALVGMKQRLCAWDELEELWRRLIEAVTGSAEVIEPFRALSLDVDEATLRAVARRWSRRFPANAPLAKATAGKAIADKDRLTIGYLSADFHNHATAYLMAEFFELHDRSRFRAIAYSLSPDDGGDMRQRLVAAFDGFVDCQSLDARQIAQRIAADGVDILVDLKGFTRDAATAVMALRPAPVQVQWIGYPGTMGAPYIDYVLGDPVVLPETAQPFYDEAIVRLPGSYQVNDRKRPCPQTAPSRSEFGLPENGLVLASFNDPYKLRPADFAVWMRLLQQVEGAVLWLYCRESHAQDNLRRAARDHGVDPARLVFAGKLGLSQHLARYLHVDLFLDTLPYNAHTTASDALWMGCPVVTRLGGTFAGRVAASLLCAVGLDRYVTHSPEDYEQTALRLLRDPAERTAIRRHLTDHRLGLRLFDTPRTTRAVENAYAVMWKRALAGLPPAPFAVEDAPG